VHDVLRLVLFDLDDTLYPEREFVTSGFRWVSHVVKTTMLSHELLFDAMMRLWQEDRRNVFDRLVEMYGPLGNQRAVPGGAGLNNHSVDALVACFRCHPPSISLYPDAAEALAVLRGRGYLTGIITDGLEDVQRRKVESLGLSALMDLILYTDSLGPDQLYWKPSAHAFSLALDAFRLAPGEACYVADNPAKDFVGPREMGLMTVRVVRANGIYRDVTPTACPDVVVDSLSSMLDLPHFRERVGEKL